MHKRLKVMRKVIWKAVNFCCFLCVGECVTKLKRCESNFCFTFYHERKRLRSIRSSIRLSPFAHPFPHMIFACVWNVAECRWLDDKVMENLPAIKFCNVFKAFSQHWMQNCTRDVKSALEREFIYLSSELSLSKLIQTITILLAINLNLDLTTTWRVCGGRQEKSGCVAETHCTRADYASRHTPQTITSFKVSEWMDGRSYTIQKWIENSRWLQLNVWTSKSRRLTSLPCPLNTLIHFFCFFSSPEVVVFFLSFSLKFSLLYSFHYTCSQFQTHAHTLILSCWAVVIL